MRHAYAYIYIKKNAALFGCCLGDPGLWTLSCVAKACATQKPWAWCLVERWQLKFRDTPSWRLANRQCQRKDGT